MNADEMALALEQATKLLHHWEGHQMHSDETYESTRQWLKDHADYVEVEVDVAHEDMELSDALVSVGLARYPRYQNSDGVAWHVKTMNGPGGGWPVVALWGPKGGVFATVVRMCDGDREQAREVMEG